MKRLLIILLCLFFISATGSPWRAGASPDDPLSASKQDNTPVKDVFQEDKEGTVYPGTIYTKSRAFDLPVSIAPQARPKLREVRLYVSEDHGKTYRLTEAAPIQVEKFRFRASRDGDYWFTLQTVDTQGKRAPPDVQREEPGLRICIDTQPPRVRLKADRQREVVIVEWNIYDRHLDAQSLRLEYRAGSAETWTALPAEQKAIGQYRWNPPNDSRLEVRLRVSDKARNAGEATVTVNSKEPE